MELMEVMEVLLSRIEGMKTEKFQMLLEKSTVEAVDDWGFSNRIRTRAEAIRRLIHMGLANPKAETKKADAQA